MEKSTGVQGDARAVEVATAFEDKFKPVRKVFAIGLGALAAALFLSILSVPVVEWVWHVIVQPAKRGLEAFPTADPAAYVAIRFICLFAAIYFAVRSYLRYETQMEGSRQFAIEAVLAGTFALSFNALFWAGPVFVNFGDLYHLEGIRYGIAQFWSVVFAVLCTLPALIVSVLAAILLLEALD